MLPSVPLYSGPKIVGAMPTWVVPMPAFLRFIGFWVAEGWVTPYDTIRGDNGVVTLSQSKLEGRLFIEN